jgi:hypothetical protein
MNYVGSCVNAAYVMFCTRSHMQALRMDDVSTRLRFERQARCEPFLIFAMLSLFICTSYSTRTTDNTK